MLYIHTIYIYLHVVQYKETVTLPGLAFSVGLEMNVSGSAPNDGEVWPPAIRAHT